MRVSRIYTGLCNASVRYDLFALFVAVSVRILNEIRVEYNSVLPMLVKPHMPPIPLTSRVRSVFHFLFYPA